MEGQKEREDIHLSILYHAQRGNTPKMIPSSTILPFFL